MGLFILGIIALNLSIYRMFAVQRKINVFLEEIEYNNDMPKEDKWVLIKPIFLNMLMLLILTSTTVLSFMYCNLG